MSPLYLFSLRRLLCALGALFAVVGSAVPTWAQFETRARQSLSSHGYTMAVGDFNGDGIPDIAAIVDNGFVVLMGNGDGTFQNPVAYSTELAYSLAIADFNNDGNLDIVVANLDPSTVSVYLGNGDGTFQPPLASGTTYGSYYIAVGDFNNDGKLDVVIIDPPYVSVLLGNGDGTFQPPSDNDSFKGPEQLAVGDFNNDHFLDVLVSGGSGLSSDFGVLLGNGNGTLQPAITYPLQERPASGAAVGDFNNDGNLDFAIAQDGVEVFLGRGDGTFQPGVNYPVGRQANAVAVGDFRGDGVLDLVEASGPPAAIAEFIGNGDGTFQPVQFYADGVGGGPWVGDFNHDGKLDLAIFNFDLGVTTMLNTGALTFSPSGPVIFPSQVIGGGGSTQAVTLTNTGTTAIAIRSVAVSGDFRIANACGDTVAAGASCEIEASFAPRVPGVLNGLITIHDSASSKPQVIDLSGFCTPLELSPTGMSFGSQKLGTTSPPQMLTVTNEGRAAVTFGLITISGGDGEDFSMTHRTCGAQLAAGATCSVEIAFSPKKKGSRYSYAYTEVEGRPGL